MALNKSIFSDNRLWSCAKCDDHLSPNFEIFDQQIIRDVNAILFKDNPISNIELLRQIEDRCFIDDHFMDIIRTNIRAANTNDQVANILIDHLRFLSFGTVERQFSPIDQDDNYDIKEARTVPDDGEDKFDDSYNLEDIIMDEYEFRSLYGNFRAEDDNNEDEADDVDEHSFSEN
jgi:hypothetical protein